MRQFTRWLFGLVVLGMAVAPAAGQEPPKPPHGQGPFGRHLADYNSELRRADGRVGVEATLTRLKDLGVVTYCLDKGPRSRAFPLAQKLFHEFQTGK